MVTFYKTSNKSESSRLFSLSHYFHLIHNLNKRIKHLPGKIKKGERVASVSLGKISNKKSKAFRMKPSDGDVRVCGVTSHMRIVIRLTGERIAETL